MKHFNRSQLFATGFTFFPSHHIAHRTSHSAHVSCSVLGRSRSLLSGALHRCASLLGAKQEKSVESMTGRSSNLFILHTHTVYIEHKMLLSAAQGLNVSVEGAKCETQVLHEKLSSM